MGSASRGFSVGVSSTSSPKVCQVIAESSEMNVFVVDDDRQLQKVIQVSDARARGSQDPHIWGAQRPRRRLRLCLVEKRSPGGVSIHRTTVAAAASQTPCRVTEATRKALFRDSVSEKPQEKQSCGAEATAGRTRLQAGRGNAETLLGRGNYPLDGTVVTPRKARQEAPGRRTWLHVNNSSVDPDVCSTRGNEVTHPRETARRRLDP